MQTIVKLTVLAALTCPLYAVDGVVLINQNVALAGNVTPGDTPGFPVTISLPGSYKLSGNLTVPDANTTAIDITADSVTLDLNGFSIVGPTVCSGVPVTSCSPTGTGVGIHTGLPIGVAISNGVIRGMGSVAIQADEGARIKEIRAISNGSGGILNVNGSVESCEALGNGGTVGIEASEVIGNFADFNAGSGIITLSIAVNNRAFHNHGDGIQTFFTGTVKGNFARDNGSAGINAGCPSSIAFNTLDGNAGGNIVTRGSGCVLANNAPAP
jgi:hypothetical protein